MIIGITLAKVITDQGSLMFYRRKDACLIDKEIPIFNRMIPYLMRGRNESMITLKESLIMTKTLQFISENRDIEGNKQFNYFEILLAATFKSLAMFPLAVHSLKYNQKTV